MHALTIKSQCSVRWLLVVGESCNKQKFSWTLL